MQVHSYSIVHYGLDYLPWALRSVYDQVDRLHVVYTPTPSHGHQADARPPDARLDILNAAIAHDPDDKVWVYEMSGVREEGDQRNKAVEICRLSGAEMILVVDCDEVWPADTLARAIEFVRAADSARDWLINFTHLWRSFGWACRDNNWPVRIIDLRHNSGTGYIPQELGEIYHFGYAVRDELMRYKWQIHGHKDELRPGWLVDKWAAWPPAMDCHPTNTDNWWMPEPFDRERLPEFMRQHPFYGLERIE